MAFPGDSEHVGVPGHKSFLSLQSFASPVSLGCKGGGGRGDLVVVQIAKARSLGWSMGAAGG